MQFFANGPDIPDASCKQMRRVASSSSAVKRQFGHVKVRYRGLGKNTAQLHTLFALTNLWSVRRQLLGAQA